MNSTLSSKSPRAINLRKINNNKLLSSPNVKSKTLLSSFSEEFLDRNYNRYLYKKSQLEKYDKLLMNEKYVNIILYRIKHYYNELLQLNNKKSAAIELMKESYDSEKAKLGNIIEFQSLELPKEKISVKNYRTIKFNKNEMEKQLKTLLIESENINGLYKNVFEYSKTLEFMLEEEKRRKIDLKREINGIEDKIHNITKSQKSIDLNLKYDNSKKRKSNDIDRHLQNDIEFVDRFKMSKDAQTEQFDEIILEKEKKS